MPASWGGGHSPTIAARTLRRETRSRRAHGATTGRGDPIAAADRRNDEARTKRQVLRSIALALSVGIPIAFVAYANHLRQDTGINWIGAIGALVALSLVIAGAVWGSRR